MTYIEWTHNGPMMVEYKSSLVSGWHTENERLKTKQFTSRLQLKPVFKIEVFNALQTRFGSSKYTSLKIALQNATSTWK